MGSDPGGLGGPWELSSGRPAATVGEAMLDRIFAEEHDLEVGTEFEMGGRTFRTVGLSEGTRLGSRTPPVEHHPPRRAARPRPAPEGGPAPATFETSYMERSEPPLLDCLRVTLVCLFLPRVLARTRSKVVRA